MTALMTSMVELLDDPNVQAVYIPLPTALRKEWVVKAANAGKHVLADKPVAVSSQEMEEMLSACKANEVQFMDGVMFMHHSRFHSLLNVLADPVTGPVFCLFLLVPNVLRMNVCRRFSVSIPLSRSGAMTLS